MPKGARPRRTHILLVDDDCELAAALTDLLEDCGYVVTVVDSGSKVAAALAQAKPDLVLLDEGLPELSGSQVLRSLSGHLPPVILMSGLAPESVPHPAVRSILPKPFTLTRLLACITEIVGQDQ